MNLAALYKSDKHTSVEDIIENITRYQTNLKDVGWIQSTVNKMQDIIDEMIKILQRQPN